MAITIALCAIVIFLFIPNYNFGFDLIGSKEASFREVKLAGEWIKANSNPEDIVITASMPQNSYYSERATYNFYLAPRRDMERKNATQFYEFIEEKKPKYLVISAYEQPAHSIYTWATNYPQDFPERVTPVKVYQQGEQPVLIIYAFNYL